MKKAQKHDKQSLLACVLQWLARREHSQVEIRQKLHRKNVDEELIETIIAECKSHDWQSDARFCEVLIRHRYQQSYGPERIRIECRQHQLNDDLIEVILNGPEFDWEQKACDLYNKKAQLLVDKDNIDTRVRQYLFYRGFSKEHLKMYKAKCK